MIKIAIVGATGLVGETIIKVLKEEDLKNKVSLSLFASEKSHGKEMVVYGNDYRVTKLSDEVIKQNFDIVFFSAGDDVSRAWAKKFAANGSYVIDNTNAFRREKQIPLVVPEINGNLLTQNTKLISNPNCSTIQLAIVLDKIIKVSEISLVVVSTYQSVSGAGRNALSDLKYGTKKCFSVGIRDNFISQIGSIQENGFCTEENKMMFELNKILNKKFRVLATTVRVPISNCHGESVYVKLKSKISLSELKEKLDCDYIHVCSNTELAFPTKIAGTNQTHICRLRLINNKELMFFVVADNLRRGAAYNAVEIFKTLLKVVDCFNKQ